MYCCLGHTINPSLHPGMWLRFPLSSTIAFPICSPASWWITYVNRQKKIMIIKWSDSFDNIFNTGEDYKITLDNQSYPIQIGLASQDPFSIWRSVRAEVNFMSPVWHSNNPGLVDLKPSVYPEWLNLRVFDNCWLLKLKYENWKRIQIFLHSLCYQICFWWSKMDLSNPNILYHR